MNTFNQVGYDLVEELIIEPFVFRSSRYEIWSGKMLRSGSNQIEFYGVPSTACVGAEFKLNYKSENDRELDLTHNMFFDKLIKLNDRYAAISVPSNSDMDDVALAWFRTVQGETRGETYFKSDEPYSCGIFFKNGEVAKLALNFNKSDRILEFYR